MRKKILALLLGSLTVVVVSTVTVLALMQQAATLRSFGEQQNTLVEFTVDNVELGLATGRMRAVKDTLHRLPDYSIFYGATLFDEDITPILAMPLGFKLPTEIVDEVLKARKVTQGEVSYEAGILKDEDGEVIGHLIIGFTFAGVKAEARGALLYTLLVGLLILVPVVALVSWQIAKMIRPLGSVVTAINGITSGDLDQQIDHRSRDEIGILAQAFRELVGYIKEIAGAASAISEGDLMVKVVARSERDVLANSFNRMVQNLTRTVAAVRRMTQTVTAESSKIRQEIDDLARRTTTQVTALNETSASMDKMTYAVKQSAESAKAASDLAIVARDTAVKGGTVTRQAVESMDSVNKSSKRILEITTLINGIADQTELLSLNAAIEAARAGEQGRGFAVVADEVAKLAKRVIRAAQEIQALVNDSARKVRDGTTLVMESGQSLEEIVESSKRVGDIMPAISAAAQEQAKDIDQVHKALMEMDQTTQENANLVAQTTATAQSMEAQASELMELVKFFKTGLQQPLTPGR